MSQPRTLEQATDDLKKILAWKPDISPRSGRNPFEHEPPTTKDARLPFGLDMRENIDDGPTGIRTESGANEWLRVMASWAFSSGNGSYYDPNNPGPDLLAALESPYPWETWNDWEAFADDLRLARAHIGRLSDRNDRYAVPCPNCASTLKQRNLGGEIENTYTCTNQDCNHQYHGPHDLMRALRETTHPGILVTRQQLIDIHADTTPRKHITNWIQRRHIIIRTTGLINLAAANMWIIENTLTPLHDKAA